VFFQHWSAHEGSGVVDPSIPHPFLFDGGDHVLSLMQLLFVRLPCPC